MKALKPKQKKKRRYSKRVQTSEFNSEMNDYFGDLVQRNTAQGVKVYNAMNVLQIQELENARFKLRLMPNANFYLFTIMMLGICALSYFVKEYKVDGKMVDETSRMYMVIGSLDVCVAVVYFTIVSAKKLKSKAITQFQLTEI